VGICQSVICLNDTTMKTILQFYFNGIECESMFSKHTIEAMWSMSKVKAMYTLECNVLLTVGLIVFSQCTLSL
jgi:hypothetical protein